MFSITEHLPTALARANYHCFLLKASICLTDLLWKRTFENRLQLAPQSQIIEIPDDSLPRVTSTECIYVHANNPIPGNYQETAIIGYMHFNNVMCGQKKKAGYVTLYSRIVGTSLQVHDVTSNFLLFSLNAKKVSQFIIFCRLSHFFSWFISWQEDCRKYKHKCLLYQRSRKVVLLLWNFMAAGRAYLKQTSKSK